MGGGGPFSVHAATLHGIRAIPVTVEASAHGGIPGLSIVGMPDSAVLEASSRIRCALGSCGYELPRMKITVNLAPGDIRKSGTGFDLPIATAILACTGQIPRDGLDDCLFVGELGLDGGISPTRGAMAYLRRATASGLCLVTARGANVHAGDEGDEVRVIESLSQLRGGVRNLSHKVTHAAEGTFDVMGEDGVPLDFADVVGQEAAKRAIIISATGAHGLLMVGPPGSGKSMLARRMPGILPPMTPDEQQEALLVHSVCGLPLDSLERGQRPFRAPHHSASSAGLVGGGKPVLPGEISLAHNGVLFLDELPEFSSSVLQALRQPMEEHEVRILRAEGNFEFPCRFLLVAAANPCPCGYLGDKRHQCRCSAAQIEKYQGRVGGPLLDRIDLHVDVTRPDTESLIRGEEGLATEQMAQMVAAGRAFASWRQQKAGTGGSRRALNAQMDLKAQNAFERISEQLGLGGRSMSCVARVARTLADLREAERISADDVMEACAFRARR